MTNISRISASPVAAQMPFGSQVLPNGAVRFNFWAPSSKTVELILHSADKSKINLPMPKDAEGWCTLTTDQAPHGTLYQFKIDNELEVPDPASRYQPQDVHGPSMVIDPSRFRWTDDNWTGRPWQEAVVYELHVGSFTPEGTFKAVEAKLDYLKDLGVTAIEIMPVSDFPGRRNWGYDGVLPYAPDSSYGTPDDLRSLINAAHARQMMVMLDVVYNHFGPEGNYLHVYAKQFFTDKHKTPWGAAINYDSEGCKYVRQYFVSNVLYWLNEFHFDGLRFDAVNTIQDSSPLHILEEIAQAVNAGPRRERQIHLVLENDDNNASLLERQADYKPKLYNAQWNDDIHHALHVILTNEKDGYYADYTSGSSARDAAGHLARCLTEGFAYQDDPSPYRHGEKRGQPSRELPPTAFVSFLQNHDQIGNRAFGERIGALSKEPALKAAYTALILSPHIPMLFMGEEWGAGTPFYFFCDLGPDLAPLVTQGRRNEFAKFAQFQDPKVRESIPDPVKQSTFDDSKLKWSELDSKEHRQWHQFFKSLFVARQKHIVPLLTKAPKPSVRVVVKDDSLILLEWNFSQAGTLRLAANLSNQEVVHTQLKQPGGTKTIFDSSAGAQAQGEHTRMPPHSARWFFINDSD